MRPAVEAEWHPRPSVHNTAEFFLRRRRDSEKCSAEHARDAGKAKMSAYAREEQCRRVSFSLAADVVERATSTEFSSGFISSRLFGGEKPFERDATLAMSLPSSLPREWSLIYLYKSAAIAGG